MLRSTVFAILSVHAAIGQTQPPVTKIAAHSLGESIEQWGEITGAFASMAQFCSGDQKGRGARYAREECARMKRIRYGQQPVIETTESDKLIRWTFEFDRLASVHIAMPGTITNPVWPIISEQIRFLKEAYGVPFEEKIVPFQNAFGARFDCAEVSWIMPDGAAIVAQEHVEMRLGGRRSLSIEFISSQVFERKKALQTNPYIARPVQ